MPEFFNIERSIEEHESIIKDVQRIRDGMSKDVIDYYHDNQETEE